MAMRSHIDSSLCNSKNIKNRNNTYSKFLDLIIINNLPEGDCVLVNSLVEEEFMTDRREIARKRIPPETHQRVKRIS